MHKTLFIALCLTFLGLIEPLNVSLPQAAFGKEKQETVIWRTTDWPPAYILSGPNKGQGLYDELIALFETYMPEYQHRKIEMNTIRFLQQMRTPEKHTTICHTSMIEREAKDITHMSIPNSLLLAHKVIIRTDKIDELKNITGDPTTMSLKKLIHYKKLRGGIASFGTHTFLKPYEKRRNEFPNLVYIPEAYKQLMHMLFQGRIDYIIQYAPIVTYFEETLKFKGTTTAINITETKNTPYIKVHTACSKNDLGERVITKINALLKDAKQAPKITNIRLRWYEKHDQIQLKQYYKNLQ